MAFNKKTWTDRLVEFAGRRKITNVSTMQAQIVDVERAEGVVSQDGSAFSAQTMNDLEQRIAEGFTGVETDVSTLSRDLGGCRFGITSDGRPGWKDGADTVYPFSSNWHKVTSLDPGGVTSVSGTFDFKTVTSSYKDLVLYRDIFPIVTKTVVGATDINWVPTAISYTYDNETGIFTATIKHNNSGYSIGMTLDLYANF